MLLPAKNVQQLQPSYIREILAAATRPEVISLAGGLPAESCFPLDLMRQAINALPDQPQLFQYGSTQGYAPLIDHIESQYAAPGQKALVCNGSQQALDLVARSYLQPGDQIVMENPGYLGAIQIFSLAQAQMLPIDQTETGPDIEQLETVFKKNKVKFFYAVPDFHNPTGVVWNLEKRQQVAKLCQQFNVTLIEDAPYRDIRFAGVEQPMVSSFCPEHSIVLRSFSKTICPGMRLGVAVADPHIIDTLIKVKQAADLHTSLPMQSMLLNVLLHSRFSMHLNNLRADYKNRYQLLRNRIVEDMAEIASFASVEGGMFIWLKIKSGNAFDIASRSLAINLAVVPGDVFYFDRIPSDCYLRLNFSHTAPELFSEAIHRLVKSIDA